MKYIYLLVALVIVVICISYFIWIGPRIRPTFITNALIRLRKKLSNHVQYIDLLQIKTQPITLPVYYITLNKHITRRSAFAVKLESYQITSNRGKDIGYENNFDDKIDDTFFKNIYLGATNKNISRCVSHLEAIKTAYLRGEKYAIILENCVSFEFVPMWGDKLIQKLIAKLPQNAGVLQLSWLPRGTGDCSYHSECFLNNQPISSFCESSCAYIITKQGMQDILQVDDVTQRSTYIEKRRNALHQFDCTTDRYLFPLTTVFTTGLPLMMPDITHMQNSKEYTLDDYNSYLDVVRMYLKHTTKIQPIYEMKKYAYRLGDAIRGCYQPFYTRKYHKTYYPFSLVGKYFSRTNRFKQWHILADVVRNNFELIRHKLPKNDTVVIHLRLGDVIEYSKHSPQEHLNKALRSNDVKTVYVKPLSYFLKELAKYDEKNVVFVYGSHFKNLDMTQSIKYVQLLSQKLSDIGYKCNVYDSDNDPDMDFLYLCFAPNLITTGGGYSKLANIIHEKLKDSFVHNERPLLINVGLPRTGTQSLDELLTKNGMKCAHIGYGERDLPALREFQTRGTGKVSEFMKRFDALGDSPYYGLIDTIKKYFPKSRLVATHRNKSAWLNSMRTYPAAGGNFLRQWYGQGMSLGDIYDYHYIKCKKLHIPIISLDDSDAIKLQRLDDVLQTHLKYRDYARIDNYKKGLKNSAYD